MYGLSNRFFSVYVSATVDQGLSDGIANAVGHPTVKLFEVKPEPLRYNDSEL